MSSPSDIPVFGILGVGLATAGVAAWWAVQPVSTSVELATPRSPESSSDLGPMGGDPTPAFDVATFNAALWNAPPAAPPPTRNPRPLRRAPSVPPHQLLCITQESNGVLAAVVFDPNADGLMTLHEGDTLDGFTVTELTPMTLTLKRGQVAHTLDVDQPALLLASDAGEAP